MPPSERERKQKVAAKPDESLLADRDQAGVAREQVPALRQRKHVEQEDQVLDQVSAGYNGKQHQRQQHDAGDRRNGARRTARGPDAEGLRRLCCGLSHHRSDQS